MSLTLYYVDPVSGSDSTGTGTSGNPWKSTQKALNTITQGAGGDQINIKSTGDDVLSATLSLSTYGTPTASRPLVFAGYTSSANDGGIGGISGNSGGFLILNSTAQGIHFVNMHLHHCGASAILNLTVQTSVINCECDHSTSGIAVTVGDFINSLMHDVSGSIGLSCNNVFYSLFNGSASSPSADMIVPTASALENAIILSASSACKGILCGTTGTVVERNSVYGAGGTGVGISDSGFNFCSFANNIVEGFSGTGGKNYQSTGVLAASAGNRSYNGATHYSYGTVIYQGTDATDSSTNFNNAAGGDLTLKSGSPAISSSSTPAGYPSTYRGTSYKSYADQGAFQYPPSAGAANPLSLILQPTQTY